MHSRGVRLEETGRFSGLGQGETAQMVFHGDRVSVWQDEKVLETDGSHGHTTVRVLNATGLDT